MEKVDRRPDLKAWLLLLFLSLIWGSSFILIKRGLEVLSSGEVGTLRIIAAAVFLAPVALANLRKLSAKDLKLLFVVGLISIFFPAFLFAIAQTNLDSSLTGVLNALTPLTVLLIGASFFKQQLRMLHLLGVALGLIGTVVLLLSGSGGSLGEINYYAFYVILATVLYGINLNLINNYANHLSARVITSVAVLLVTPFAMAYLLFYTDYTSKTELDGFWIASFYIALLGTMSTAVALMLFNKLVQQTTPIFTSSVTYLIPIVAICWGVLDGEVLLFSHYLGIGIIMGGVYLVNK